VKSNILQANKTMTTRFLFYHLQLANTIHGLQDKHNKLVSS